MLFIKNKNMNKRIPLVLALVLLGVGFLGASILPGCNNARDGGIFKSEDGGSTWEQKVFIDEDNSLNKSNITALAINPSDSQIIYAGVGGQGIYKTIDGGDSWRQVLPREVDVYAIAIDPSDANMVYASALDGNNGKVFKSPNGFEETFEESLVEAQGGLRLVDMEIDHYDPNKIYALSEKGGIFKSEDAGITWRAAYWYDGVLTAMDMSPQDSRLLYVGTSDEGVIKTTDGGETWEPTSAPEKSLKGAENTFDLVAISSETVYAATEYGLLRTNDGGVSWEVVNVLVQPGEVSVETLVIPVTTPNIIYFATGNTLHKSTNGGQTWSNWLLPTERKVDSLVLDPGNADIIYTGVYKEKK